MIKVLIVDDSPTARMSIRQILESDNDIRVVAEAETGAHALGMIRLHHPDIITMDVFLKDEDGIIVTSAIMASYPRPILIVTGVNPSDPQLLYRAIEAGALDVVAKPSGPLGPHHDRDRAHLLRMVKTLAKVPVVHRFAVTPSALRDKRPVTLRETESMERVPSARITRREPLEIPPESKTKDPPQVVLIGASTGGPRALSELLSELPRPFFLPIVIIQHIPSGFSAGFAEWLSAVTKHKTMVVTRSTRLRPGEVYVAPDDHHLRFTSSKDIAPDATCDDCLYVPSYDALLESAGSFKLSAIAVVMTGMGSDGTRGLKQGRSAMSLTIAQTPKSCVVDGMPSSAISANLIDRVLDVPQICALLRSISQPINTN